MYCHKKAQLIDILKNSHGGLQGSVPFNFLFFINMHPSFEIISVYETLTLLKRLMFLYYYTWCEGLTRLGVVTGL